MKRRWLPLCAALVVSPAAADVVLSGSQHIGDCQDTAGQCAGLTPPDPQSRNDMFNTLVKFHLSTTTTIEALRLDGAVWPDREQLQVHLQPLGGSTVFRPGTYSGASDTYTFMPSVVLPPGDYSVWVDGGCSTASGGTHFHADCSSPGNDNDFGFSSITLVSAQVSTSRMLNRRRHIGDDAESDTGDADGDYDGAWYPDAPDGNSVSETFTLDANRRLSSVSFYSVRDLDSTSYARVLVDGTQIGTLDAASSQISPLPIGTNLLLLAGAHILTVQTAGAPDRDDISWDDIVLKFADTGTSGTPGLFNAVDSGANAVTGALSTKAAAASPGIDIVALDALGSALNTGYTGTVTVELMDASVDGLVDPFSGCQSTWTAVAGASTTAVFAAADAGRVTLPAPFFSTTLRKAALRMTDGATGAVACSADRFALRPDHFLVTASQGTETTPGANLLNNTGATGLPRHKAGQPFTIQATAVDAAGAALAGYDGTLDTLHTTTALAPATVDGTVTTGAWIASGALRTTDEARYDEAGSFSLQLRDSTYADVDAGDTADAQRWITGTADVGRFIPDHFAFAYDPATDAEFAPGCVGVGAGFTYLGQPFGYAVVPTGTLTAMTGHSTPVVMRNYTSGALYKLTGIAQSSFAAAVGTLQLVTLPNPDATLSVVGSGVTRVTLSPFTELRFVRGAPPAAPFAADVAIALGALSEGDDVIAVTPASPAFGDATPGNGVPFTGGANEVRFGRLVVGNAQGPEQHPLAVPIRTEYWDAGFQTHADDTCTPLAAGDFSMATGLSLVTPATLVTDPPGGGTWTLTLTQTAPQAAGVATVTAVLGASFPWLQTDDADADANYDDDPTGLATFGLSSGQDRQIFQREVVGD